MVDAITQRRRSKLYGLLFTLLVTGAIVIILLLILLHTPIPPYPEGGGGAGNGIELNLGSDAGMGNNPQELSTTPEKPIPQAETQTQPDDEKVLTQDQEEAPAIAPKPIKTKKVKKDVVKPTKKEIKKEPKKIQQTVNPNAMMGPKKSLLSADGNKNVSGDQGAPDGNLGAKAFGGQSGKGGSGGGIGGGNGTGTGTGNGTGVSFNLEGRTRLSLPPPEYKGQEEGAVVVEVTVDKEGKVTQAVAGVKGSTTLDETLLDLAKRAAVQARFDRKPDAPAFQKGTITYRFRLQ